jgi:hypothetical protein
MDDINTLTLEQMAARIAEREGRLAKSSTSASRYPRKELYRSMVWGASR